MTRQRQSDGSLSTLVSGTPLRLPAAASDPLTDDLPKQAPPTSTSPGEPFPGPDDDEPMLLFVPKRSRVRPSLGPPIRGGADLVRAVPSPVLSLAAPPVVMTR